MYRIGEALVQPARIATVIAAFGAIMLLGACPGPDDGRPDSEAAGSGSALGLYPLAEAEIPVLREPADPLRRSDCLSRTYVNGHNVPHPPGLMIKIEAHDSTVLWDRPTLESGEHYLAIMIAKGSRGLSDYALVPGDTTCWAVRADSVGLESVFYGPRETVRRPLTIEWHSEPHAHADADWIFEDRYPSEFRLFDTTSAGRVRSSWVPPFLTPSVAYASSAAIAGVTDKGGSGPWTTCIMYGCCKPR